MNWILLIIFAGQLVLLYILSRQNIQKLFEFLRLFIKSDSAIFLLIAVAFLPGTIIHEMSHFVMATILLLKVREVNIFPRMEKGFIKLGSVVYVKRDVIRSILVGIAPIIVGLLFFWWLSYIHITEVGGIGLKALVIYVVFIMSTTMFSSKQDLVDIVYVIPVIILISIFVYFFPIDISFLAKQTVLIAAIQKFLYDVNIYIFISIAIHCILLAFLFVSLKLLRK